MCVGPNYRLFPPFLLHMFRRASDGTLITQRFHFAQTPYRHRHVLGWYRLIKELNDANVSTICVFDGKERSSAKGPEVCKELFILPINLS